MLVIDEMVEPSRRECGDKSLVQGDAGARDRRFEAVSWRCVAAVPLDLIGPLTMMRSRVGGRGRSPGMQAMVPTRSMSA